MKGNTKRRGEFELYKRLVYVQRANEVYHMKKVLVVITTGFVKYGGLANAFMNYYRFMDKSGLHIDVASMNEPEADLKCEVEQEGGKYYRLPDKREKPIHYLKVFYDICKGYDVVHVHGNSATMAGELILARMRHVRKRLAHCHNMRTEYPIMNFILKPFFRKSYTRGIAVSKAAGNWLYGSHPYTILYNAIDTEKFRFDKDARRMIRGNYQIDDDTVFIGNVGKINLQKNHAYLLEVFSRIHNDDRKTKLIIIGDGTLRGEIERKAESLGLENDVIFAGMISDPSKYYSAMDVFMFPSVFEGFGIAVLEAQASGLQCIASMEVPTETDVTGNIRYLDFDVSKWAEEYKSVLDIAQDRTREEMSSRAIGDICTKGLDSRVSGGRLKEIYLE